MSIRIAHLLGLISVFAMGNCYAINCLSPVTDGVTGSLYCQDGSDKNDQASDLTPFTWGGNVATGAWTFLQKQDTDNQGMGTGLETGSDITASDVDLDVSPTNNTHTGDWSFSRKVWDMYAEVVVVLKGGENPHWVAYYLNNLLKPTSGDWLTTSSGTSPGLSHFSLYARGTPTTTTDMPEPSTILLILMATVIMLFRKYRTLAGQKTTI